MPRYDVPIVARPARPGSGVPDTHVLFHVALEAAFDAWITALEEHCSGLIVQTEIALVHVEGDFHRELSNGSATADVAVRKVGGASVTLVVELFQEGPSALAVTFVFVHVGAARTGSQPWTAAQRSALEALTR
jgi:acyl-CoA thioesterase FadM